VIHESLPEDERRSSMKASGSLKDIWRPEERPATRQGPSSTPVEPPTREDIWGGAPASSSRRRPAGDSTVPAFDSFGLHEAWRAAAPPRVRNTQLLALAAGLAIAVAIVAVWLLSRL
jgi:hypothetical protein